VAYRCRFVAKQIRIKAKYSLWVTAAEKATMSGLLTACPGLSLRQLKPGGAVLSA
jgi:hypothetical protein